MKKQTQLFNIPFPCSDPYGSLSMPVYHTVAYEFGNASEMSDAFCGRLNMPDYSRVTNPTVIHYENIVKSLTGARDVIALASGMAAISNAFLALTSQGKNIVASRHVFGNTYLLMTRSLKRFGVEARLCDLTDMAGIENSIDDNTSCIYLEIITNPQMEVADLKAISNLAHSHGIPLVADTTAIPFTMIDSRGLGIDIEIISSTKYISGGATSIGGLVIDYGYVDGFSDVMRQDLIMNFGAYMTPHAAYMQTLGLETLDARYKIQSANALEIARKLKTLPEVKSVGYVGLEDNQYYELSRKQFGSTSGAMVTIELENRDACFDFINRLKVFRRSTNLFDNKSLAIHPASTIYGNMSPEMRESMDVSDNIIRLSIGLEDVDDLFEDLKNAICS